ncbi:MAG: hypothetical protein OXG46_03985 [Chloroflexi bacterium]|nr:hypothetical protein [Chloroflexota bacterium]MCY3938679.1 hypothetical protein [Chloroflexota bacterium]
MNNSLWTYPWDVADDGLDDALATIRDVAGCNGVSLTAAYHNFTQLRPHSRGPKIYMGEGGVAYFRTDQSKYGRIKPVVSKLVEEIDVFRAIESTKARFGLDLNAWTVVLHNSRLATTHPDCAMHTVLGDPLKHHLCPSNPESRHYAVALASDLAASYDLRSIELEAFGFHPFLHETHHPKVGAPLGEWGDYLLSICFCPSCKVRGEDAGVDVASVAQLIESEVLRILQGDSDEAPEHSAEAGRERLEAEHSEFAAYSETLENSVVSLVSEIKAAVEAVAETRVLLIGRGLERKSLLSDPGLTRAVQSADGLITAVYGQTPTETAQSLITASEQAAGQEVILGHQTHYPEIPNSDVWREKVSVSIEGGATGLNFYNYGISTINQLRGIKRALQG